MRNTLKRIFEQGFSKARGNTHNKNGAVGKISTRYFHVDALPGGTFPIVEKISFDINPRVCVIMRAVGQLVPSDVGRRSGLRAVPSPPARQDLG